MDRAKFVDVEYLEIPYEGRQIEARGNLVRIYEAMDAFLTKHTYDKASKVRTLNEDIFLPTEPQELPLQD